MTHRTLRRVWWLVVGAATVLACNENRTSGGFTPDTTPPTVAIVKPSSDTLTLQSGIVFSVTASDNLALQSLHIGLAGGYSASIDSTFTGVNTNVTRDVNIPLPSNSTAGGIIVITAIATDGNSNADTAVDSLYLKNTQALSVTVVRPSANATTSPGKQIPVEIRATQLTGVRKTGYVLAGVVTGGDSVSSTQPYPDSVAFVDTVSVAAGAATGTFTVTGFAEDSTGRRATSAPITVTVQSVTSDNSPPTVTLTVAPRVEVRDSVTVRATDPSGINFIGWSASTLGGTALKAESTSVGGSLTDATESYVLGFSFATLPQTVIIRGFATDANGNRTAVNATGLVDTVVVVNGITKALPAGGRVADAVYNTNRSEFYLTNVALDRIEVFQLSDTSFVPGGVPVGSRPWGIALWPRDTLGDNADSVVVANSGGTNLSVVNMVARKEVRRQQLPNFLIQFVSTSIDPTNNQLKINIVEHDFSDRPEYIGTTCRPNAGGTGCSTDSVYAIYSTTPTADQSTEYANRGTLRWENMKAGANQSHFFWEQAEVAPSPDADSLQVLVNRYGQPTDTVLSAACGVMIDPKQIAFAESTYVRNSGNFTHALVGEGGAVAPALGFARVIGYNGEVAPTSTTCSGTVQGITFSGRIERDNGVTTTLYVRNFIANTAIGVKSIAVNFNGLTNLVRADSIYVLDKGLFLQGIIDVAGGNPGMDLNFDHNLDADSRGTPSGGDPTVTARRIVFAAGPDANIYAFDTFYYGLVAKIPIRDPIIGPLRVAKTGTGEQILVGVTSRGVVTVRLPAITNPFPAPSGSVTR